MDSTSPTYQSIATAFTNIHNGSSIVSIERIENILLFENTYKNVNEHSEKLS